uniref:SFRICE_021710 n=1 Tax=Spodoptera frugiperda TaxID=7108 RepID=A0A2H1WRA9_SPOFR
MQTVLNWHGYKVRNEDIRFGRLQPFRRRRENRSVATLLAHCPIPYGKITDGKPADRSPEGKQSPPPVSTRNTRGVTSALSAVWLGCWGIGDRATKEQHRLRRTPYKNDLLKGSRGKNDAPE